MPETPKLVEAVARAPSFRPTRDECVLPVSPVINRIAEALFEVDATIHDFKIAWCDAGVYRRFCYRMRARAAVEAMREPTDAMADAGRWPGEDGEPKQAWREMIDAALASTEEPEAVGQDSLRTAPDEGERL